MFRRQNVPFQSIPVNIPGNALTFSGMFTGTFWETLSGGTFLRLFQSTFPGTFKRTFQKTCILENIPKIVHKNVPGKDVVVHAVADRA